MFLSAAFFSSSLLASQVLAAPSGSGLRPLALSSGVIQPPTNDVPDWAGAFLDGDAGTYTYVTGTFTVPTLPNPNPNNGSFGIWAGIDGINCPGVLFHAGVSCGGQPPACGAWYEWTANNSSQNLQNVSISAGDVIKVTVNASSETYGTARIDNENTGEWEVAGFVFPTPICGQTAEWIVEDFTTASQYVPLGNFGTVTFTNASASNSSGVPWGTGTASILDIEQNNTVLTNVTIADDSVTIQYIGNQTT